MPSCTKKCSDGVYCQTCLLLQHEEPANDQTNTGMLMVGDDGESEADYSPMMNGGW
jgi:hypothetical protein